jgi:hypothetical protein
MKHKRSDYYWSMMHQLKLSLMFKDKDGWLFSVILWLAFPIVIGMVLGWTLADMDND